MVDKVMERKKVENAKFLDGVVSLNKQRQEIMGKRNMEYSHDNDYSANFTDVSIMAKGLGIDVLPSQVATILVLLKMVRYANAVKNGDSPFVMVDHIIDLHNYIDLSVLCNKVEGLDPNDCNEKLDDKDIR